MIMLRKRTRSIQKDQHHMSQVPISDSGSESFFHSDVLGHSLKTNSLFPVPGLLVGFNPKGLTESDSVWSPTSPLEFRVFSNVSNSFRSPRSTKDVTQRSWDNSKVGLRIIDSLDDDRKLPGKVLRPSESKNIIFGPRLRIKSSNGQTNTNSFESTKSLPKNCAIFPPYKTKSPLQNGSSEVLFEIGETPSEPESFGKIRPCSLDSCRKFLTLPRLSDLNRNSSSGKFCLETVTNQAISPPQPIGESPNSNQISGIKLTTIPGSIGSANGIVGSLSASDIELSEDYTCVISHGPNPKTTHIFGDCVLETLSNDLSHFARNGDREVGMPQPITQTQISNPFSSNDFLSFCYSCNKKLEEGKDIYIYRFTTDSSTILLFIFQSAFDD